MKIAQIIYTGFGGLGSVAFSLVEADKQHRHEWIIGFIGDLPIDQSYPPRCAANGVAWQEFRSTPGRPYRAWLALARWLGRARPDAVILHSINSVLPCRWYTWRHRVPLIAVEHTSNAVKTRSERAASRLSMLLADRVVLLTADYREELASAQGRLFRPSKVSIIPNGIDTGDFHPSAQRTWDPKTVRLGMASRFSFSKRQDLLVETMRILKDNRPDVDWQLSLAGDGDRFDSVQRLISSCGIAGNVSLEGLIDEAKLSHWLKNLDIYVHASEGETLSTSLLQAMATGLPIVASDVSGIRNLLMDNGEIGVLAANDPAQFAEAIIALADNAKRRADLAAHACKVCVSNYSHETMLKRYVGLLTHR